MFVSVGKIETVNSGVRAGETGTNEQKFTSSPHLCKSNEHAVAAETDYISDLQISSHPHNSCLCLLEGHLEGAALKLKAVQVVNGILGLLGIAHGHEAVAFGNSFAEIHGHIHLQDGPKGGEETPQGVLRGVPANVVAEEDVPSLQNNNKQTLSTITEYSTTDSELRVHLKLHTHKY